MRRATQPEPGGYDHRFAALATVAHRVAYRILGSQADAEEIAQETMARAFTRWSRIDAFAEPWVARVAANLALGQYRKTHRRAGIERTKAEVAMSASDDVTATMRLDLVQLLLRLPRRQREVVVLRFLADRSEADTATALGCSVGTVKQHSHRALAALRLTMTDAEPPAVPDHEQGARDVRTT